MKKISAMMSMVLALSLLPVPSMANSYPQFNLATGTVKEVTLLDSNQEVRFRVDLGKDLDLNEGRVIFEINNAKLAKGSNLAVATIYQGSKVISSSDVVFSSPLSSSLEGQTLLNLDIKSKITADHLNDLSLVVSFKLDFTESKLGDVSVSIKDIGKDGIKTGIGDYDKAAANAKKVLDAKDADIRVQKSDTKIGPAGGELSNVLIYQLEKLSNTASDNQIIVRLPKGYSFKPVSTKVVLDSGSPSISYNRDYTEMTITNVSKQNAYINILPSVVVKADNNAKSEAIYANIEFVNNKNSVFSKDVKVGELISYGITLSANEKGQKTIPTLSKGIAKTVELNLDIVEGSLNNGSVIDFEIDNARIVFDSVKVVGSDATLTTSRPAIDKVSGYIVHNTENFSIRLTKSGLKNIKLEFDLVSELNKNDVTVTATPKTLDSTKTIVAKNQPSISVDVTPISVEKGVIANLPTITLKETAINTIQKGDKIYLELIYPGNERDRGKNVAFSSAKDIKVETTNGIEVESINFGPTENILVLTIGSRSYSKTGTIKLSNIAGYLTEKAPENQVNLNIKINSATEDEVPFFTIGKPVSLKTIFTINSKSYLVSGTTKTLVTAPYVKEGRTMLPVRAVGESLGLVASWDNVTKTATFKNDSKVAVVKVGSSVMTVNNTPVQLSVPAEIKDGSVMIELRSLATAFGVNISWDNVNKTVTIN